MARPALGEDGAVEQVEGREQRGGAVTTIVVRHALDVAEAHGEERLGAIEGLHLAFLVDAQDQRLVRRVEIEPDHVAQFLDEERVGRQLEGILAMRLQPEHLKETMDAGLGDAGLRGQPAHTPMGGAETSRAGSPWR